MNKKILEKLIGFNTVTSSSNMKLIDFCGKEFAKCGFKTKLVTTGDKANLFAYKKCLGPRIILSAHSDTVPESGEWTQDPFVLLKKENKYFGLGVCDMKSFIGIMLEMAGKIKTNNLAFLLTFDEETTFSGAKLIGRSIISDKDIVIIGEPTNNKVLSGNKGALALRATIKGVAGHGSRPSSGISAIEKAATFICKIEENFNQIAVDQNSLFGDPAPTFNFGTINGGDAINKIADKVVIDFEFRTTSKNQTNKIMKMIGKVADKFSIDLDLETLMDIEAHVADKKLLKKVSSLGFEISPGESYCTEANIFCALTKKVLVFGPGDAAQAHSSDEFISVEQLERYEKLLERLILNFNAF